VISFRYHIVSIVAVFLALALGIVIGTTALSGPITRDLRKQVNDGKKQRDGLVGQVKVLQGQVDDAGDFATTYGQKLVAGSLSNANVVEVVLPSVPSAMRSGVERQLGAAGAKISGRVLINKNYLDSSRSSGIVSLATGGSRPLPWNAPETSDAGQIGGSLLAFVLLGKGQKSDLTSVLGGFSELHMLAQDGDSFTPATNVVVIGHGEPATEYGGSAEEALVAAFVKGSGKVVVAGDAAAAKAGGVIGLVRNSSGARDGASTVDDADSAFGQVSTALALSDAIKGNVGQYGTQDGADTLFPSPSN